MNLTKILKTKPTEEEARIRERESEIMLEDYRKGWDHEVELCRTRTEYLAKGIYYSFKNNLAHPLKIAVNSLDVTAGLVLSFIPGGFSRMMKDSVTGRYILRLNE